MTDWVRVPDAEDDIEEEVWSNDEYGNIVKSNGVYNALLPVIFALGPFNDLKEAQRAVLMNYDVILKLAHNFNPEMLRFVEDLRRGSV